MADLAALLDALGFPPDAHPEADALAARFGADEPVRAFLRRALHGVGTDANVNTFDPVLIDDWNSPETRADEDVSAMLAFADDGGGRIFLLDPRDRLGFGAHAVYTVGMGTRAIDDVELVAPTLEQFLQTLLDGGELPQTRLHELRDAQTAGKALPLRLGDGSLLPTDAVTEPRYHVGADILRSVHLTKLVVLGVPVVPMPGREGWDARRPDVSFYRDGRVETAFAAGGVVAGYRVVPGSPLRWAQDGRLTSFTPAEIAVVNGVRVKAGVPVHHDEPTFFFTPAEDTVWKGFLCKGGEKVDDYGPGLGRHFTHAQAFSFHGQPVPAGVKVTVTADEGLRFKLIAPLRLGDRDLPAGASLWYDRRGQVREVYVPS